MKYVASLLVLFEIAKGLTVPQQVLSFPNGMVPSQYNVVQGFFEQNGPDESEQLSMIPNGLGLKPSFNWSDVVSLLEELNEAQDNCNYKLFLLARHGEGYHNIAPSLYNSTEWTCNLQRQDGADGIEWFDASLTTTGQDQIRELSHLFKNEIAKGMPIPQSFYISPMRRTLQTFELTWGPIVDFSKTRPIIKEFARETYGIATESKRHNKSFIEQNWNFVQFEEGFTELDQLWEKDRHESHQHRNFRARLLLNDIFVNDNNHIVSITAHRGIIRSILKVIHHRKWNLNTGEIIPVIVKASHYRPFEKPELNKPWKSLPAICSEADSS